MRTSANRVNITVQVPRDLHAGLTATASKLGETAAATVRQAVREFIASRSTVQVEAPQEAQR
jgi:predicted transcriptional regulator